jgi:glycosyltransferase involved in cell wall biosynthesis
VSALDPTGLLLSLDWEAALAMFWFMILLDVPRYTLSFAALLAGFGTAVRPPPAPAYRPLVSVIVAGHNEAASIGRCVRSLREQNYPDLEIVCVDDGSTDRTVAVLRRLRAEAWIDRALATNARGGKSSAANLGCTRARGEIVVLIDADCTFDRDAIAHIVAPFAEAGVGAVCGNIAVRNGRASLTAALQAMEYLVSISLGKRVLDMLGIVTCVSGAFGAYRADALRSIGGMDAGPGEDLDATLRLRRAGWTIRFAEDAWCLTDVPEGFRTFVHQRLRWERDALRLRMRKHRDTVLPWHREFRLGELMQQLEFVVTNLVVTIVFPFYLIVLLDRYGAAAVTILVVVTLAYVVLDAIAFCCAMVVADRPALRPPVVAVFVYGAFNAYVMRAIRLVAYVQEWVFERSRHDDYVPARVRRVAPWR